MKKILLTLLAMVMATPVAYGDSRTTSEQDKGI